MKRSINSLAKTIAEKLNENNVKDIAGAIWFELQKEKKTGQLEYLLQKVRAEIANKNREITAEVLSKNPLTKDEMVLLEKKLNERFSKKIDLTNRIDQKVLGGIKIQIGDEVIDLSWREKLNAIKTKMVGANG